MPTSALPPEFAILSRLADAEEPNVRKIFQYALATPLVEGAKAQVLEQRAVGMREQLTPKTAAGDTFRIVKPDTTDALLAQVREMVREILGEDRDSAK